LTVDPAHVLAIDAGTTGVTAILFDGDLRRQRGGYREFAQRFPAPGWVEHEAGVILAAVDGALADALSGFDGQLAAVGVTNQRETVFAYDRAREEFLGPGIVWQDRRTAARCTELAAAGHLADVRRRTGLVLDPYFSATKIEWLLRERPEVGAAAGAGSLAFGTVDTLVLHHLTRGAVWATDVTNASRTLLYDIDAREWSAPLLALFGVDAATLPEVRRSIGGFGEAHLPGGRRAPILGVAGDQQAALFGQGCFEAGSAKSTYGTGNFLMLNTGGERKDSTRGLLTTLAVSRTGEPVYALEGSVFSCGTVIQWLRDELGFFDVASASEALARSVPDAGGVTFVPAFTGLGAPYWDADARAAILGLTRGTGRAHIARAALEAIAFQCAEVMELMREASGLPLEELLVDGGAAANDLLMQMQADVAGVVVRRPADVETTARGAAGLAGVGAGLWEDPREAAAFTSGVERFTPTLSYGARAEALFRWRRAVARVLTS
jgi:glycerol kinase